MCLFSDGFFLRGRFLNSFGLWLFYLLDDRPTLIDNYGSRCLTAGGYTYDGSRFFDNCCGLFLSFARGLSSSRLWWFEVLRLGLYDFLLRFSLLLLNLFSVL